MMQGALRKQFLITAFLLCGVRAWCAGEAEVHYANPMTDTDAADPCMLVEGDKMYLYSTGARGQGGGAFPVRIADKESRTSWTYVGAIFTSDTLPLWAAISNRYWAPEVHRVGGQYVCYYCTWDKREQFCIGAATSATPAGPFRDIGGPLASATGYGLIDAAFFQDPQTKRNWVLWKEDKNALAPQQPTDIVIQEVTTDGLKLIGKPTVVLTNDQPWENELVEAPTLIFRDGWYYMFFSANGFSSDLYGVGVARSRAVTGPYVKFDKNPILKSNARFDGPGHQFLFEEKPGEWTMFYHAREVALQSRRRLLMSDPVNWTTDGWPSVHDGTPSDGWRRAR